MNQSARAVFPKKLWTDYVRSFVPDNIKYRACYQTTICTAAQHQVCVHNSQSLKYSDFLFQSLVRFHLTNDVFTRHQCTCCLRCYLLGTTNSGTFWMNHILTKMGMCVRESLSESLREWSHSEICDIYRTMTPSTLVHLYPPPSNVYTPLSIA